jgi:hypothetical protein
MTSPRVDGEIRCERERAFVQPLGAQRLLTKRLCVCPVERVAESNRQELYQNKNDASDNARGAGDNAAARFG